MTGPFSADDLQVIAHQWDVAAAHEDYKARTEDSAACVEAASLCRRTAESIRLEARTGQVHCVCHLRPVEECGR